MNARGITFLFAISLVATLAGCGGGGGGGGAGAAGAWPQTLSAISPSQGSTLGGTTLVLSGSGFLNPQHPLDGVRFGQALALEWEIIDDSTIRLTTPPGQVGPVTVFILGANSPLEDGILLAGGYEYVAESVFVAEGAGAANPTLYRVDLDSGRIATVGPVGFAIEGMAMAPDGMLWGVEGGPPHRLVRIDPSSGAGVGVGRLLDGETGTPVEILDLTFLGERLLGRTSDNSLAEIELSYGTVTRISTLAGAAPGGGVALAGEGMVFLAPEDEDGHLSTWDSETDVVATGPQLAPGAVPEAIAVSGSLIYGIDADPIDEDHVDLLRIDPATGQVRAIVELPPHAGAIARDR